MKINIDYILFLVLLKFVTFSFRFVNCEIPDKTSNNLGIKYVAGPFESTKIISSNPDKFDVRNNHRNNFLGLIGSKFNLTTHATDSSGNDKNLINWILGAFSGLSQNDNESCKSCQCGISYKMTRIVGGTETQVNMYPWIAVLTYNSRFYCGATVINNKYLITASHCVNGFSKEKLGVTFLVHDRESVDDQTFTRKVKTIIPHKAYHNGGLYNNDIALLEIDPPLIFNHLLRPVCLPAAGRSYSNQMGIVIGWGATSENGQVTNKLREVEVPILSNENCRKTGYGNRITENMMCAGFPEGNKDSCQGDSGGPLLVRNDTRYEIAGIVSWGEGCGKPNYPGVYTRVNRYLTWIMSNAKNSCYCS